MLEELQTLRMNIDSNLELLEHFVNFLRTSRQVKVPDPVKVFFSYLLSEKLLRIPPQDPNHRVNTSITKSTFKLLSQYLKH